VNVLTGRETGAAWVKSSWKKKRGGGGYGNSATESRKERGLGGRATKGGTARTKMGIKDKGLGISVDRGSTVAGNAKRRGKIVKKKRAVAEKTRQRKGNPKRQNAA